MFTLIATLHVIVALMLILLVLIQDSKGGAGMFAGGSSQSILGATGGATLLAKMTRVAALIFAFTCIFLTIYTAKRGESVTDKAAIPAPTTPANPPPTAATNGAAAEAPKPEDAKK